MTITLELDPNKIDYDDINKQIKEKIDAMNGGDVLKSIQEAKDKDGNLIMGTSIRNVINSHLGLVKRFTSNGEEICTYDDSYKRSCALNKLENQLKELEAEMLKERAKDIFDKTMKDLGLDDETIGEVIAEIFPSIMYQVLYD